MTQKPTLSASELESRKVAEASRQTEWTEPSFLKELFLGNFRLDLIHPYPDSGPERPEFTQFFKTFKTFMKEQVDSGEIDRTGEYPPHVVDGLRKLGAFGMKIPKEYGGLGFTQVEYDRVMQLLGSLDGNVAALLSAHQSIGVPQPIKMFGTAEQKKKYLPRCAAGAISAFALTEENVGSDPAKLATTIELAPEGDAYIINGNKLWCTNGTFAELLVVMARHKDTGKISALVVEANSEGIKVEHRCHFMGLKAIGNAVMSFKNVRVPKENLIGKEGAGLKIALVTLNTGRLALPSGATGTAKACLEICRRWANERVQWGAAIGKHEAIGNRIADMAATTFAMESVSDLSNRLADRGGYDIRLEAAAAKEWNTVRQWEIVDDTMQIRGGRGYETEKSLADRGEPAIPVERVMRDSRINRIFEGSSEVMHLFIAREAVDVHLKVAGSFIDQEKSTTEKLAALPGIAKFYAWWYPTRWVGMGSWTRYSEFGMLAGHLAYVERAARKLARESFHGMAVYQAKMQRKQGFLFRIVDIGLELFAMAAAITRVQGMKRNGHANVWEAYELVDLFCRTSRRKVDKLFQDLWSNDDARKYKLAMRVLKGDFAWLEEGVMGLAHLYQAGVPNAPPQLDGRKPEPEQAKR